MKQYSYYYQMKQKADIDSMVANITAAIAAGAVTGGAGVAASGLLGKDMLSGATSSIIGELTGDTLRNNGVSKEAGSEIAGLTGGLSALVTGALTGLNESEISSNIFNGQRLGKNAAENNAYRAKRKLGEGGKLKDYKNNEDSFLNKHNIEVLHEQWFFEDIPNDNIGFFGSGLFSGGEIKKDSEDQLKNYTRIDKESYNDSILREAFESIDKSKYTDKYNIFTNNCQGFSEDLRQEYFKILNKKNNDLK